MVTQLPRELRDMIYGYLWTSENLRAAHLFLAQDSESMRLRSRPHIMDPTYVGCEMALESLEKFYHLASDAPETCHLQWPEQVRAFVHNDVFGLGLVPARFLRALTIRLDLEWLTTLITRTFDASRLEYFLAPLYDIAKKDGFKLCFQLRQHRIRLTQWEEAFRVLAPVCRVFETAGANVHVSWTYYDLTPYGNDGDGFTFSLDKFVQHPRSVWKSKAVSILNEHRQEFTNEEYNHEDDADYNPRVLGGWNNYDDGDGHPYDRGCPGQLNCDWRCGWFRCQFDSCKREECVRVREAEEYYGEEELHIF
jgi:hypothetical protein